MPQPAWKSLMNLDQDTAMFTHHEMLRLICSEQRQLKRQVELLVKQSVSCIPPLIQCGQRLGSKEMHNNFAPDCGKREPECQRVRQDGAPRDSSHFVGTGATKDNFYVVQNSAGKDNLLAPISRPQTPEKEPQSTPFAVGATKSSTLKSLDEINSEFQLALKRVKKRKKTKKAASRLSFLAPEDLKPARWEIIVEKIVMHPIFDSAAAMMIVFNSVLVAASVEHLTTQPEEDPWMVFAAQFCNIFFFVELVFRMVHQRKLFFTSEDKLWNVVDVFLVVLSVVDFFEIPGDVSVAPSVRTVKMLRVVRMFRVFRFCTELSVMASMIASSLISALWAGILICIIMFTFAIFFTQQTTNFLVWQEDERLRSQAHGFFGSVPRTFYNLVQAMLGGKSWGEYTDVLSRYNAVSLILFLVYVTFMLLAVLNVITGVFVDTALESAGKQRDYMIAQEMNIKQKYVLEMKKLFSQIDVDRSGTITLDEVTGFFNQEKWAAYFNALGVDATDVEQLFILLDDDGSGALEIHEFVDGLIRIKGDAKRMDCAVIIHSLARVEATLKTLTQVHVKDKKMKPGRLSFASSTPSNQEG